MRIIGSAEEGAQGVASEFLTMYREEGDARFDRIIMGNETWVHYWTPESKATSTQSKHKDEKLLKKFKKTASAGKVMATVFCDGQSITGRIPIPEAKHNPRDIATRSYAWETQLSENARGS